VTGPDADRFRSMGCDVIVAGAVGREARAVRDLFERWDATFSRFRPDSELRRVNAAAGRITTVSPLFASALRTALDAWEATEGVVDPCVGAAVEGIGYDRDFACLKADSRPAIAVPSPGPAALSLHGCLLRTSPGTVLDLNGVVKAMAVDAALALLSRGGWVSAGGDLAATSPVDVALPGGGAVRLECGGLATSGSTRRRWLRGGAEHHHLIEPATGAAAISPWTEVTVCGASCLEADIAAKAAFLLGDDGVDWLGDRRLPGRLLAAAGGATLTSAWRRSLDVTCI
jgi:thiamine biosynthesis lipoprotein